MTIRPTIRQVEQTIADARLRASQSPVPSGGGGGAGGIWTVPQGGTGITTATAHGVVLGNGTGAFALTTAGNSGQVLTSNGASADPTFQTPATGTSGSFILLQTVTASSSASVDLTGFAASYNVYVVVLDGVVPASNNVSLYGLYSTDGGVTWSGGTAYTFITSYFDAGSGTQGVAASSGGTAQWTLFTGTGNAGTTTSITGRIELSNFNSTALWKHGNSDLVNEANGGGLQGQESRAAFKVTAAVNGFQVKAASGNIASGTVRMYGLKNA